MTTQADEGISLETHSMADFAPRASVDVLEKCSSFGSLVADFNAREDAGGQFRVEIEGPLDHRIRVRNQTTGAVEEMVCFDSNGYLGLQRDPRVVAAVQRALADVGYGTPSAQLLGGTSRYLRELEDTVSAFLGREATAIFPSGYAANIGALTALLSPHDFVAHDRFAHASIADGARYSRAKHRRVYAHGDMASLENLLARVPAAVRGRLVVTDGLFSMHASVADLPSLRRLCDEHSARLMIDDAHGLGVLGATGRGIEEHWGMQGSADILMGTFSKAPGSVGGYVSGSRALVEYLRFFARAGVFTAALPAATCAGIVEAFRIMEREPEHRARLWDNAHRLWSGLKDSGWVVPKEPSPIVTVLVGHDRLLYRASRELFDRGFKVGVVSYPAVAKEQSILRMSVSARHTAEDLDRAVDALAVIGRRYGVLHQTPEEIVAIGSKLSLAYRSAA
jgi:4-hydroxy-2,2'-bipyrrole-5-methanol synthase